LRTVNVRMVLIAWVLLFACGQSLISNHIHVDNSSYEDCLLCVLGHSTPAAIDSSFADVSITPDTLPVTPQASAWIALTPRSSYHSRAPPHA
jgi:hypothetical protein